MPVRVAEEWFAICGGCEVTILDVGEPLLELLPELEFVHMPVIMDHKIHGQTGERTDIDMPEVDVAILSGGIRNEENRELAKLMRERAKTLIAMGTCACSGGIPALANQFPVEEIYDRVYRGNGTTDSGEPPDREIPALLDRVYAIDEVVDVDLKLPGCPTTPQLFASAILHLLGRGELDLPTKSVCDTCPVIRQKKAGAGTSLKRPLEPIEGVGKPLHEVRCLMEQGFLCQGPATRAGCAGEGEAPRCLQAYMPCRGCYGPVSERANPMVDMMGALASVGLDAKAIPDRAAQFNRFAGAGRLRPMKGRR